MEFWAGPGEGPLLEAAGLAKTWEDLKVFRRALWKSYLGELVGRALWQSSLEDLFGAL